MFRRFSRTIIAVELLVNINKCKITVVSTGSSSSPERKLRQKIKRYDRTTDFYSLKYFLEISNSSYTTLHEVSKCLDCLGYVYPSDKLF